MTLNETSNAGFSIDRRRALQVAAAGAGIAALARQSGFAQDATPAASPVAADIPVSGEDVPELAGFDTLITGVMSAFGIPGGQLAIARDDRLVFNRGYGYASVEDGEVVAPDSLFRIASNSKAITAVAILELVDSGDLTLDTQAFPLLALEGPANAPYDARLDMITIEQLLVHSGGWNSSLTQYSDPQYLPWPALASHLLSAESPAEPATIVRYMLSQPLDFDPGTVSAYSNFGFNVLGRVIEQVSGQAYDQFVIDNVLTPAGITGMAIGGTLLEERQPGEVRYYSLPGLPPFASVYPGVGFVPAAYGGYYMPALDAHGGWIGSAADQVRFALAVDGRRGTALLTPEAVTAMETTSRPPSAAAGAGNTDHGLGLGWNSAPVGDGYEWTHSGALEGSNCAWLVRKADGTTAAFSFNTLPIDFGSFFGTIIPALQEALGAVTTWPEHDLFV